MQTDYSIESLDRRLLLAAFTVNGASLNDDIALSVTPVSIVATVNGVTTTTSSVGFDGVIVQAGNGADQVSVNTNTLRVTVVGGDGDDSVDIAYSSGSLSAIGAGIVIDGGIGDDAFATFDDLNAGLGRTYVLTRQNSLDWNTGVQILSSAIETVSLFAAPGADTMYVDCGPSSARFNLDGAGGNDRLLLSLEASPVGIPKPVTTQSIEDVYFNDSLNTFGDTYTLSGSGLGRTDWAGLQFLTGPQFIDINTGMGSEVVDVQSLPATLAFPPSIETGPGADRIYLKPVGLPVNLDAGAGDDSIYANPLSEVGSLSVFVEPGDFNELVLGTNTTLRLMGLESAWSRAYALRMELTSRLDLSRTSLILDVPSLGDPLYAQVDGWLASGYAGGNWNGYGIGGAFLSLSGRPTGIGSGPATLFSPSLPVTLGGFSADLSSIILRHTLVGDTNLDRSVNFDDLLALAQNYGTNTLPFWFRGDFNYDGDTDFDNLLSQAQNYQMPYVQTRLVAEASSATSLQRLVASKRGVARPGRAASMVFSAGPAMI